MSHEKFEKYDVSVLYVEDDKNIRELGKEILLRKVSNVLIAENGFVGHELFFENNPEIVITDINMPGMTGLELAAQIKALNIETEIVISSAFSDSEHLKKAIDIGISVFVVKPFDSKKLFNALDKCWSSIKLRREVRQKTELLIKANAELEEKVLERTTMLRFQHEYTRKLVEMDPSIILSTDMEGNIKFANKTIVDIFGLSLNEIKGKNCFDLFFDSDENIKSESIAMLIDQKKTIESLFVYNEKKIHVLWDFRFIYQDDVPHEILIYGTDITFRKDFELLLNKRNLLLRAVAQSADYFLSFPSFETALNSCLNSLGLATESDMVVFLEPPNKSNRSLWPLKSTCFWTPDPKIESERINSKIEKMILLINDNRLKTLNAGKVLILSDTDLNWNSSETEHMDIPFNYLIVPILIDGSLSSVLIFVTNNLLRVWDEGEISILQALASTLGNVFKRKSTEDELKKLGTAVDQSSSVVFITDRFGNIEYVNPKFLEITLYSSEEVIGKNPRILKSGKQSEDVYRKLWETISSGCEWHGELYNKKKNNDYYWAFVSISPIRNDINEITHYIAIQEDITDYRKISEELEKAKETAESANKAKTIFLANMSHELRTPLNGIMGMTGLLETTELTNKQSDYLKMLKSSSEILLQLIANILDLTKIESGKMEVNKTVFNLNTKILEITDSFTMLAAQKRIALCYTLDELVPQFVVGDYLRLQQILSNLIGNAVKFTDKGNIDVKVKTAAKSSGIIELLFSITDTGIGISSEKHDKLFKRFSQVDGSSTRKYGGTGLGLAIAKQLVELMDGAIWFESKVNEGSTFNFTVKFGQADSDSNKETITEITEEIKGKPKLGVSINESSSYILLVDDSSINRYLLVTVLQQQGYKVDSVADGKEAVEIVSKNNYDAVLMDIQMPIMDGLEATMKIRDMEKGTNKHLPIIALTAHVYDEDKQKCKEAGMDDYISKPVDYNILFSKLNSFITPSELVKTAESVDLSDMLKAINGNQAVFEKLTKYFIDNYPAQLDVLFCAIKDKDYDKITRTAHTLKAAVGNFGAKKAFELINSVETMGRDNIILDSEKIISEIINELRNVEKCLKSYKI